MEPLLTLATAERHADIHSWTPYEDRATHSEHTDCPDPARPTVITIGDGQNQQLYACPASPQHPHTALLQ